ncbi:MAG TPA: ABC transporter substrate-binding protein [bacterium]|nr:ABC transporter substrate-binding protein [bacterium]
MDERVRLLVMDFQGGRYTRRQFIRKALGFGVAAAALPGLLEMAGTTLEPSTPHTAEAASSQRTLVVGIPENVTNPDPVILGSTGYGDIKVVNNNINEPILRFKTGTVDLEPCLATTWDISTDGLVYTFHLRPASFHDGTPVTASAIKLNYDRQIDDKNPYHFAGITYTEIVFSNVSKIDAVNDRTLRITQSRPAVTLLSNLALFAEGIVSPAALKKYGKDYSLHPTGSGPYKFERWAKGVEFVETAYPQYWGGRPWVERVVWKTVADNTVRLEQLRTGELDLTTELDFKDVAGLRADRRFQVVAGNFLDTQYVILNQHKPPFDKREARQAVQYAVNKANIAKVAFYGNYTLGAGPVPPGLVGYDKSLEETYPHDPAKAKALLEKAGANNMAVTLLHKTEAFWPEIAQLLQADLQAAGLQVSLQGLEEAAFYAKINASEHQMGLNDWVMDTSDPDDIMWSVFSTKRARQRMGYENPQVDKLNKDAQVERDPQKRREMYLKSQQLILQDAPFVTLGYAPRAMGAKANVQGLLVGPLGDVVIRGVKIG